MSTPFLGEIRMFGFNFAPVGWALCNGQLLPIQSYTALFSLLGTTYGGNGTTTFALPNLQSRVPIHMGQGSGLSQYIIGQAGGAESVTLLAAHMPTHTHAVAANSIPANTDSPAGAFPADTAAAGGSSYSNATDNTLMNPGMIAPTGGSQPHTNIQPYLVLNFCIALEGVFPSRS
jgi:microcystin-dependent protein